MQVSFPWPVRIMSQIPQLNGTRFDPFTNIDGEPYARPSLNGHWRVQMQVVARGMQGHLALSSFITSMSGAATCVVPISAWLPNDQNGRRLTGGADMAPSYTFDHVGFHGEPFDGFKLRAAANRRDSYVDINKPALSQLWPGHFITLGDRLHQVVNVNAIGESETAIRVSVMPNLREDYAAGTVVIVDQLRLRCRMLDSDQISQIGEPFKTPTITFVEAF